MKFSIDTSSWYTIFAILYNIPLFLIIFGTIYYFSEGMIMIVYSLYNKTGNKENSKKNLLTSIIATLTQLGGLLIIAIQISYLFFL